MSATIEASGWLPPELGASPVETSRTARPSLGLARVLSIGDAVAIGVAFAVVRLVVALLSGASTVDAVVPVAAVAIGLSAIRAQGLWYAPRIAVRWTELTGLTKAVAVSAAGLLLVDRIVGLSLSLPTVAVASVLAWILLVAWRSVYRSWLTLERGAGRHIHRTIVVGTTAQGLDIVRLAEVHPEAGAQVIGIVGSRREADAAGRLHLWLGAVADLEEILAGNDADRVVIASPDVAPATLATLVRAERTGGPEVVLHAGLPSVAAPRVIVSAFAHEAVLHVAPTAPSPLALATKRLFDIVVAGAILLVASPLLAVLAILVKKEDGGPVLFRQQRVGRNDAEFGMLKFRTMVVDAEARLAAMQRDNQRTGPLFKMARDSRTTRIGNVLRRTSLDELPQLINVLKGDMSLIGPRPALRREVEEFPADLHARHRVRPGITGLWQVEARDNPAFDAYRRLDMHYVENWSLALDLVVLLSTVEHLAMRPFASRSRGEMTNGAGAVDDAVNAAGDEAPAFATAA